MKNTIAQKILLVSAAISHIYDDPKRLREDNLYPRKKEPQPVLSPTKYDLEAIRKAQLKRQRKQQTKLK